MATKQNTQKNRGVKTTVGTKGTAKKGMSKAKIAVVGAGLAAVGAGAYYLMGPKGKTHQKKAKALMAKIEKEAKSKIKLAKAMAKPAYDKSIDLLADTYSKEYKLYESDIKALAKRLKGEWKNAKRVVKKSVKDN